MLNVFHHRYSYFFVLVLLTCFGAIFYFPVLGGWFIFDDLPNLEGLNAIKESSSSGVFWDYVFGGHSSELGRPLALFTFALQAEDWFVSVVPFKLINICIHIANAFLVYCLTHLIFKQGPENFRTHAAKLALLVSLLWLLHPINVSTVAYIVQRMALLSGFFILLGFYCFLYFYHSLAENKKNHMWAAYVILIYLVVTLGVLSKENAALLFLGNLAYIIAFKPKQNHFQNRFLRFVVYFPIGLGFLIFLGIFDSYVVRAYEFRDFTLSERLLTQTRMLCAYIGAFLLPLGNMLPFFNDHIVVSASLFEPITTFYSTAFWIGLLLISFLLRRWCPFILFGVLWYLGFHFLESGPFAMELYYEHRAYIPIIGLIIGLVAIFAALVSYLKDAKLSVGLWSVCGVLVIWGGGIIYSQILQVRLWSNPVAQSQYWYENNPLSLRAADHYGTSLMNHGYFIEAENVFLSMDTISNHPIGGLHRLYLSCAWEDAIEPDIEDIVARSVSANAAKRVINYVDFLVHLTSQGNCKALTPEKVIMLISTLTKEAKFANNARLFRLKANLYSQLTEFEVALNNLNIALTKNIKKTYLFDIQMDKINVLLGLRDINQAKQLINELDKARDLMLAIQRERLAKIKKALPAFEKHYEQEAFGISHYSRKK